MNGARRRLTGADRRADAVRRRPGDGHGRRPPGTRLLHGPVLVPVTTTSVPRAWSARPARRSPSRACSTPRISPGRVHRVHHVGSYTHPAPGEQGREDGASVGPHVEASLDAGDMCDGVRACQQVPLSESRSGARRSRGSPTVGPSPGKVLPAAAPGRPRHQRATASRCDPMPRTFPWRWAYGGLLPRLRRARATLAERELC